MYKIYTRVYAVFTWVMRYLVLLSVSLENVMNRESGSPYCSGSDMKKALFVPWRSTVM